MLKWEKVRENKIEDDTGDLIHRYEVEGRWLYRNIIILRGVSHVSMAFVPKSIEKEYK